MRRLVSERPALATAAWDWGFGDWETALGAASHTGRRDIAELLMSHGARPTVFTLAMLGDVDAVRAIVRGRPGTQRITGPHGLSLLHHARAGGEAAAVVAFLETLGDADPRPLDLRFALARSAGGSAVATIRDGRAEIRSVRSGPQEPGSIRRP